ERRRGERLSRHAMDASRSLERSSTGRHHGRRRPIRRLGRISVASSIRSKQSRDGGADARNSRGSGSESETSRRGFWPLCYSQDSISSDIVVLLVIPVILLAGVVRYIILPGVTGPVVLSNTTAYHGNSSDTVGCITPPRQMHAPQPEYPKSEREAHHEGTV